jgi:hypothetical protein
MGHTCDEGQVQLMASHDYLMAELVYLIFSTLNFANNAMLFRDCQRISCPDSKKFRRYIQNLVGIH